MNVAELSLGLRIGIKLTAVAMVFFGLWRIWRVNRTFKGKYSRAEISLALNCVKKVPDSIKEPDLTYILQQRRIVTAMIFLATGILVFGDMAGQAVLGMFVK